MGRTGGGEERRRRLRLLVVILATVSLTLAKRTIGQWPLLEELLDWVWNGGVVGDAVQLALSITARVMGRLGVPGISAAGRIGPEA